MFSEKCRVAVCVPSVNEGGGCMNSRVKKDRMDCTRTMPTESRSQGAKSFGDDETGGRILADC